MDLHQLLPFSRRVVSALLESVSTEFGLLIVTCSTIYTNRNQGEVMLPDIGYSQQLKMGSWRGGVGGCSPNSGSVGDKREVDRFTSICGSHLTWRLVSVRGRLGCEGHATGVTCRRSTSGIQRGHSTVRSVNSPSSCLVLTNMNIRSIRLLKSRLPVNFRGTCIVSDTHPRSFAARWSVAPVRRKVN